MSGYRNESQQLSGAVTVTWPDGFSIQTEWEKGKPTGKLLNLSNFIAEKYRAELMHPELKENILQGLCTAGFHPKPNQSFCALGAIMYAWHVKKDVMTKHTHGRPVGLLMLDVVATKRRARNKKSNVLTSWSVKPFTIVHS